MPTQLQHISRDRSTVASRETGLGDGRSVSANMGCPGDAPKQLRTIKEAITVSFDEDINKTEPKFDTEATKEVRMEQQVE